MASRTGALEAAILMLDSEVEVEEDQILTYENAITAEITAGNCRIGVMSVYLEGDTPIGPYLDGIKWICSKLGLTKLSQGDVNAWSIVKQRVQ
ncbi:hypothetical protein EVAR_74262_1 [Eumeta japonica]|uniref:Uncharacterized protein n=1 Tax=Eumeta variegata TaxID=151549 RepID=A0A4C1SDF7_EUMVA|nr:hypothetical protein EVAR_74262_1 [Eumeta japonica]